MENKFSIFQPTTWFTSTKLEDITIEEVDQARKTVSSPRSSIPTDNEGRSVNYLQAAKDLTQHVNPGFNFEVIPFIRKLALVNPDLGQAAHNLVMLGNTGHRIKFDKSVSPEQAVKMQEHLVNVTPTWVEGAAGMHGLVNKLFKQAVLGGAISFEAVPLNNFSGLRKVILVNPETIRHVYNPANLKYEAYQIQQGALPDTTISGLSKLNAFTYRYYGLDNDTELPTGNPMFITALASISDQKKMLENIRFVIGQMGIMGFLQMLVDKPEIKPAESDAAYAKRLDAFLDDCKTNIEKSMKSGVLVGYSGDHEFEFHSATKTVQGVKDLFEQNELQVGSGLKHDMSMLGRGYSTSEGQITVVFQKMLAEISNLQGTIKEALEFIYSFEFRLAGFEFKQLEVKFNPSTIMDDLKLQQAQEIKVRNNHQLYIDGIISLQTYAQNVGYDEPDQKKPRVDPNAATSNPSAVAQKKQVRKKGKTASDKKVREKNKPVTKSRK